MAAVKKGERSLRGLNSPDHDVEQNDGSNNAAFDVVMNGEGKDHRYDENLALVSGGCTAAADRADALTRVRLFETCLKRIVHTDSPLAPSTLLGPWRCRRMAASDVAMPFLGV